MFVALVLALAVALVAAFAGLCLYLYFFKKSGDGRPEVESAPRPTFARQSYSGERGTSWQGRSNSGWSSPADFDGLANAPLAVEPPPAIVRQAEDPVEQALGCWVCGSRLSSSNPRRHLDVLWCEDCFQCLATRKQPADPRWFRYCLERFREDLRRHRLFGTPMTDPASEFVIVECVACGGTGQHVERTCNACEGSGQKRVFLFP